MIRFNCLTRIPLVICHNKSKETSYGISEWRINATVKFIMFQEKNSEHSLFKPASLKHNSLNVNFLVLYREVSEVDIKGHESVLRF